MKNGENVRKQREKREGGINGKGRCHRAERNGNVKIAREDVAMFITDPLRSVGKS